MKMSTHAWRIVIVLFSDQTTFKRDSVEDRFIPLTMDIGEITKIDLDFKKTGNIISSSWYSSSWTFTRAIVLNGDNQQRYAAAMKSNEIKD